MNIQIVLLRTKYLLVFGALGISSPFRDEIEEQFFDNYHLIKKYYNYF